MNELSKVWLMTIVSFVVAIGLLGWLIPTYVLNPVRDQGAPEWVNTLLLFAFACFCASAGYRIVRKGRFRAKEIIAARKSDASS